MVFPLSPVVVACSLLAVFLQDVTGIAGNKRGKVERPPLSAPK